MLNEFIDYLHEQIGEPYLWGGQHTLLTRANYKKVIRQKEKNTGGYPDGESYADAVIKYCTKKFENPDISVLYGYDCSGLGCYWLYNLMHVISSDMTAQKMSSICIIMGSIPKRGYWLFRFNTAGTKISHIGYMVDDKYLIEAKGRRYGVKRTLYRRAEWDLVGIPKPFISEIQPLVKVLGNYVNIRDKGNTSGRVIKIAKKGERYPFIDRDIDGWYEIYVPSIGRIGYISDREDLTRLE